MSLVSTVRDLHRRKARERRGLALAEGVRLVEELLDSELHCTGAVISPSLESTPRGRNLVGGLRDREVEVVSVPEAEFNSVGATENPQGIVVAYQPRTWGLDEIGAIPGRPLVLLDALQDPGNVGTIARTALAFGASGLVALPGTVDLTNPKVVRSAAGALFKLPSVHLELVVLQRLLADSGVELWAAVMNGEPKFSEGRSKAVAIALGNEGAGVSPDLSALADRRVGIPIRAEAESLNVAVTAGILLQQLGSS